MKTYKKFTITVSAALLYTVAYCEAQTQNKYYHGPYVPPAIGSANPNGPGVFNGHSFGSASATSTSRTQSSDAAVAETQQNLRNELNRNAQSAAKQQQQFELQNQQRKAKDEADKQKMRDSKREFNEKMDSTNEALVKQIGQNMQAMTDGLQSRSKTSKENSDKNVIPRSLDEYTDNGPKFVEEPGSAMQFNPVTKKLERIDPASTQNGKTGGVNSTKTEKFFNPVSKRFEDVLIENVPKR